MRGDKPSDNLFKALMLDLSGSVGYRAMDVFQGARYHLQDAFTAARHAFQHPVKSVKRISSILRPSNHPATPIPANVEIIPPGIDRIDRMFDLAEKMAKGALEAKKKGLSGRDAEDYATLHLLLGNSEPDGQEAQKPSPTPVDPKFPPPPNSRIEP